MVSQLKAGTRTDACTPIFRAALNIIAKRKKQPKCPSTDEWLTKMQSIHTMNYDSVFKRNELLIQATTAMYSENIMLSEICQTQNDKYYMISLI